MLRALTTRGARLRTFHSLPIIDVRPLEGGASGEALNRVARELADACKGVGFFYARTGACGCVFERGREVARSHGLTVSLFSSDALGDDAATAALLSSAASWFELPEEAKAAVALSRKTGFRGYQRLGSNVTRYGDGGEGAFVRDHHAALDYYRETGDAGRDATTPLHARRVAPATPSPVHAPRNPWPSDAPGAPSSFEPRLRDHLDACLTLGGAIMRGLAVGLGAPATAFEEGGTSPASSHWACRTIHYPPLPPSAVAAAADAAAGRPASRSAPLSCGEHTDYGALTLVAADAPGLQVRNAAGDWVAADPRPGCAVVNVGDCLRVWSGGAWQPTLHRVVHAHAERPRTSVAFFYEPAFDVTCESIVPGAGGGETLHYGRHLTGKVLSNFELEDGAAA